MLCPNCAVDVESSANFCPNCGTNVIPMKNAASPYAAAAAAQTATQAAAQTQAQASAQTQAQPAAQTAQQAYASAAQAEEQSAFQRGYQQGYEWATSSTTAQQTAQQAAQANAYQQQSYGYAPTASSYGHPSYAQLGGKSKIAAGLLAIFLGVFGVHKFYLGYNKQGVIMLLVTLLTFGAAAPIMALIALIEGIMYLVKNDSDFYYTYELGNRPWF